MCITDQSTAFKSKSLAFKKIDDVEKYRQNLNAQKNDSDPVVLVCCGTACRANGSMDVVDALKKAMDKHGVSGTVIPQIKETGCHGFCSRGSLLVIKPQNIFYGKVKPKDAEQIVTETILKGEVVKKLLYKDPNTKKTSTTVDEIPFYNQQERIVLGRMGTIDPFDINDALREGAYQGLVKALSKMEPQQVIEEVKTSVIRGRGGAGFPAGVKWATCAKYDGPRYVICNADEGDPGAFMDGYILEGDPHSVLEGMIIAAYAIGSSEGYMYVRFEYPLAVRTLKKAVEQAREFGLLGENILGSGLNFDIKISTGAGAFVCGESTALMASLEGRVGRPRAKYIRSVEKGFRGSPSNLNNVETYSNIPKIILNGGKWYAAYGTEKSTGTKAFSLTGDVNNIGLVEVPMGTPLEKIIFDIGGGIPKKRKLKAVQTGGPSGGCIPETMKDIPVDFENLAKAASIIGSGGMIVMDENSCMVEVARYFVKFLTEESCGQCVPCRDGLKQMLAILTRITEGQGTELDLTTLEELSPVIKGFSLCGLGTSAPNPALTTIWYFREEYEEHIHDKFCKAGICKNLFQYIIDPDDCTGCTLCIKVCPSNSITGEKKQAHNLDVNTCTNCHECFKICNFDAIKIERKSG